MFSSMQSKTIFLQSSLLKNVRSYLRHSLIINAIYLLGINLSPAVLGFLFWGLAGRLYRPSEVGIASAIISAVTLVSGIAGLGLNTGIIRFLSESNNPVRLLNTAYVLSFILSILFSIIFFVGVPFWSPKLDILVRDQFLLISFVLFVIFATLGTVVRDTFTARRSSKYGLYYALISNSTRLGIVFFVVFLGSAGIISAVVFAFGFALLVSWLLFLPRVVPSYVFKIELHFEDLSKILPYSIGTYLAGLMTQLPQTILPLMIFSILGPELNAYAYVGLMLGFMIATPGSSLAMSAFAESSNDLKHSLSFFKRAAIIGFLVTCFISLGALLISSWILSFFGSEYVDNAKNLFRWLCFSAPFTVLLQFSFAYLRLLEKIMLLNLANAFYAFIILLITFLLIRDTGITSPGIATFVGTFLILILLGSLAAWKDQVKRSSPKSTGNADSVQILPKGQ